MTFGSEGGRKDVVLTRVYLIASSHAVLTSGIIPSRCAMNSSGRTVVFVSISTMSMATNQVREPSVLVSALSTHRLWVCPLS